MPVHQNKLALLRLGFVPLTDAAPLILAQELGLFQKHGLRVALCRELGWATIRDKIIFGELDAAHALAPMPVAATLGLGSVRCACVTGLVLNLHGNAITLSRNLARQGVRDGRSLHEAMRRRRRDRPFTFGVVARLSSHHILLRRWLAAQGISGERDMRIVVVPPPQMPANLKAGHLDGFCAGEPWNSVAVQTRAGWCAAACAELAPGHPEKVLLVRKDFAERRPEEHVRLIAALLEACDFCGQPENHAEVSRLLARPEYVGVAPDCLRPGLTGEFVFGDGTVRTVPRFMAFGGIDTHEPSAEKAGWVLQLLRELTTAAEASALNAALGRQVFRADIFAEAVRQRDSSAPSDPAKVPLAAA